MAAQQFSGRSRLVHPSAVVYIVFFVLPWKGCYASINFLNDSEFHSETNDVLQLALGGGEPLLGGMVDGRVHDGGSMFTAFRTSSSMALFHPSLEDIENSDKLVGWFLSPWAAGQCQGRQVTEHIVKETARLARTSSARLHGMRYFGIDSCWLEQQERSEREGGGHQKITVNKAIFPNGIAPLAQVVKAEGLLFGLGVSVSLEKCTGLEPFPVAIAALDIIHTISNWGVDFIKLNSCGSSTAQAVKDFRRWSEAARASSTPPLLLCTWTKESPQTKASPKTAELNDLCDIWISPERNANGWPQLKEKLDAWLISQHRVGNEFSDVPRFTLPESAPLDKDAMQTKLTLAAVLGSQMVMEASSISDLTQYATLLKDDVLLAALSDPINEEIHHSSGPGDVGVLTRQLANGEFVVALINWRSQAVTVTPLRADFQHWCGLHKPVPLRVSKAWATESFHWKADEEHAVNFFLQGHRGVLLHVELADNMAESQQALIVANHHSGIWTGSEKRMFPAVDVFYVDGKPPAFTAGSRVVHKGSQDEFQSSSLMRGSNNASSAKDQVDKSVDNFLKTFLGLLLPVMVASTLDDSLTNETPEKEKHKGQHHHHHKRHHHHKHKHNHHKDHEQDKHEQDSQKQFVAASLRRSPAEPSFVAIPADGKVKASSNGSLPKASEPAETPSGSSYPSAGWMLLTALAALACIAVVAVWRALLVKRIGKSSWGREDTQLMERPHAH